MMPEAKKTKPLKQNSIFADKYPNVADWVFGDSWIEVSQTEQIDSFVRTLGEGGMVFEGKSQVMSHNITNSDIYVSLESISYMPH